MKNILKSFIVFTLTNTIISCNNSNDKNVAHSDIKTFGEIEKASWLIGEWQNNSPDGNATEIWEKTNDSVLSGKSFFVIGKDTVSYETISLEQNGMDLFYVPTVKNQNNDLPVKFTLTSSATNQLIFENAKHDFPQKITYTQLTNDSLLAEISGIEEGKPNSIKFPMTRSRLN